MEENQVKVSIDVNLEQLPACGVCDKGAMLPLMDETKDGRIFLKGWVCSTCREFIYFKAGTFYVDKPVTAVLQQR